MVGRRTPGQAPWGGYRAHRVAVALQRAIGAAWSGGKVRRSSHRVSCALGFRETPSTEDLISRRKRDDRLLR